MRRPAPLLLLAATLLLAACERPEEIAFKGQVVYIQECSLDMLRPVAGYAIQLDEPEGIGASFTYQNTTYGNVVLLFDPNRIIRADDRVHGSFYFDSKAARQYCTLTNLYNVDIPQGVFIDVRHD